MLVLIMVLLSLTLNGQYEPDNTLHGVRVFVTDGIPVGSGNQYHELDIAVDLHTENFYTYKASTGVWTQQEIETSQLSGLIQPDQINGNVEDQEIYEDVALNDGDNIYTVPFELKSTSIVYHNGRTIRSTEWSGVGTTIITILAPVKKNDYFEILKN